MAAKKSTFKCNPMFILATGRAFWPALEVPAAMGGGNMRQPQVTGQGLSPAIYSIHLYTVYTGVKALYELDLGFLANQAFHHGFWGLKVAEGSASARFVLFFLMKFDLHFEDSSLDLGLCEMMLMSTLSSEWIPFPTVVINLLVFLYIFVGWLGSLRQIQSKW